MPHNPIGTQVNNLGAGPKNARTPKAGPPSRAETFGRFIFRDGKRVKGTRYDNEASEEAADKKKADEKIKKAFGGKMPGKAVPVKPLPRITRNTKRAGQRGSRRRKA